MGQRFCSAYCCHLSESTSTKSITLRSKPRPAVEHVLGHGRGVDDGVRDAVFRHVRRIQCCSSASCIVRQSTAPCRSPGRSGCAPGHGRVSSGRRNRLSPQNFSTSGTQGQSCGSSTKRAKVDIEVPAQVMQQMERADLVALVGGIGNAVAQEQQQGGNGALFMARSCTTQVTGPGTARSGSPPAGAVCSRYSPAAGTSGSAGSHPAPRGTSPGSTHRAAAGAQSRSSS